jgi:hypothetical protein
MPMRRARSRSGMPMRMHEVFAEGGRQGATATGFIAGLAGRVAARRPLLWIRQDFAEIEAGALSMSGLAELGLDPRLLVTVRAADVEAALRTAADALACDALGVVVLEVWGQTRQLDLVASRGAAALDGGDAMDRTRGAFAAGAVIERVGCTGVRCTACPQPSWPCRPVDHGMEM